MAHSATAGATAMTETAPPCDPGHTHDDAVTFVLALGPALHEHGAPAHRVESALEEVAQALGLEATFLSTPTSLISSFKGASPGGASPGAASPLNESTHLARLEPAEPDLGKLSDLDALARRVVTGATDPRQGSQAIVEVVSKPVLWNGGWRTLGFLLASASAARVFGGGGSEVIAAGLGGIQVGLLAFAAERSAVLARLWGATGAFLVATLATYAASVFALEPSVVIVSALIVLVPGLTLTVSATELAQGSLVSGTSRLAGGLLALLLMGFGAFLGTRAGRLVIRATDGAVEFHPGMGGGADLPAWTMVAAVLMTALAFTILLQAKVRDTPWIVGTGLLTWLVAQQAAVFGTEVGAAAGATILGVTSNLYSRVLHRPAIVTRVSSVLLLVPGAIGFRGVASLLHHDTISGVDAVLDVATIAVAIVVGLLLANAILPPRRTL